MVWLFGSSASTWSRGRAARCYSSTWQWLTFCSTWLCLSVPATTSPSSLGSLEAPSATSASSCWQWTAVEVLSSWWLSLWTGTCVWCIPIIPSTLWVSPKPCVEHLRYGCSASQCQLTSSLWNTTQPTARASWSRLNPNLIWAGISLRFSSPSLSLWLWSSTAPSTLLSTWEGDSWASKQRLRRLCASSQLWQRSSSFASSQATSCSCWFGSRPSDWPTASPHLKSALPWKTRPTYFTSPSAWPISTVRWILWSTTSPALPSRTSAGKLLIWQQNPLKAQRREFETQARSRSASCDHTAKQRKSVLQLTAVAQTIMQVQQPTCSYLTYRLIVLTSCFHLCKMTALFSVFLLQNTLHCQVKKKNFGCSQLFSVFMLMTSYKYKYNLMEKHNNIQCLMAFSGDMWS